MIDNPCVSFGMIKCGFNSVSLYPNTGINIKIHKQGKIIFKGKCMIGNASAISIGDRGIVIFGNNFIATVSLRLTSHHRIEFKENVLMG